MDADAEGEVPAAADATVLANNFTSNSGGGPVAAVVAAFSFSFSSASFSSSTTVAKRSLLGALGAKAGGLPLPAPLSFSFGLPSAKNSSSAEVLLFEPDLAKYASVIFSSTYAAPNRSERSNEPTSDISSYLELAKFEFGGRRDHIGLVDPAQRDTVDLERAGDKEQTARELLQEDYPLASETAS